MAGYEATRSAIETRFATLWPIGNPVSPVPLIAYDNAVTATPSDGSSNPSPWVRLSIRPAAETQVSLGPIGSGTTLFRVEGVFFIGIFVPIDAGTGKLNQLADFAAGIYRGQSFGPVTVWDCSLRMSGAQVPNDPWYQGTLTNRYKADVYI